MKQAIVGIGFLVITILTVLIVMALGKENTEENLLEESVEVAIYQSLEEGMQLGADPGELFCVNLSRLIDEDSVNIEIVASDAENGILSVVVCKEYHNFGYEREIQVVRTVIYEREI